MSGCEESTPDPQKPAARPIPETRSERSTKNKIVEKIDPDGKGIHLTSTGPGGQQIKAFIGDEAEIPEEFPKDVPIYPGSIPMAFLVAPNEGVVVTFKSSDEQQDIFDFYQSTLADDGWAILEEKLADDRLSLEAIKESRKVSVRVTGTRGDARVNVVVTSEN